MPLTAGILPSEGHSSLYRRLPQKPHPALIAMGTISLDLSDPTPLERCPEGRGQTLESLGFRVDPGHGAVH